MRDSLSFHLQKGSKLKNKRAEQKVRLTKELQARSRQMSVRRHLITNPQLDQKVPSDHSPLPSPPQNPTSPSHLPATPLYQDLRQSPPSSFNTSYPKFLQPHEIHPYRRINNSHVEKVMNDAVKRVEDQVKNIENRRIQHSREFEQRIRKVIREADKDHIKTQNDARLLQEFQRNQIFNAEK